MEYTRFPWAANEPPRATHCGVSSRPLLPLESRIFHLLEKYKINLKTQLNHAMPVRMVYFDRYLLMQACAPGLPQLIAVFFQLIMSRKRDSSQTDFHMCF